MSILAKLLVSKLTGSMGKKLILAILEVLVKRTDNKIDDELLQAVKKAL